MGWWSEFVVFGIGDIKDVDIWLDWVYGGIVWWWIKDGKVKFVLNRNFK